MTNRDEIESYLIVAREAIRKALLKNTPEPSKGPNEFTVKYLRKTADEDECYVGLCNNYESLSWIEDTADKAMAGIKKLVDETELDIASENAENPGARCTDHAPRLVWDNISQEYMCTICQERLKRDN